MIVYGERIRQWVADQLGAPIDVGSCTAIGLERDGRLHAGVVYTEWNLRSVVCHWAIRGAATRAWLWYIHYYAFAEIGAHKVIAPVWSDNVRMLRIAGKMGFIEEARLTNAQPNGDILLMTMTADQSRYLKLKMNTTAERSRSVHPETRIPEYGKTRTSPAYT